MTKDDKDKTTPFLVKRHSPLVTPDMAGEIKSMLDAGMHQHDIAAHFKINQGRVSEINTGIKYLGIKATQPDLFR